jgi:hypothetical protein
VTEPRRERLAAERIGLTHRFEISTETGTRVFYLTCGIYPDGRLGELFIHAGKEGSLIAGALDGLAISVSIGLQHGVPLHTYLSKMRYTQFEPSGLVVGTPEKLLTVCGVSAFFAKSPFDYVAAYLEWKFPEGKLLIEDLALLPKPAQE